MTSGYMISHDTWRRFIMRSAGSARMKHRIICFVDNHVRDGNLIDCYELGYMLGAWSADFTPDEERDFEETIRLTRDMNNVPIVRNPRGPVS